MRNGIQCHNTGEQAATLEGRIVRLADHVAYINHDIDDALRAGVFSEKDIPTDITRILGERRAQRFDTLITSVVENSGVDICMSPEIQDAFDRLHTFMFDRLYYDPVAKNEEKKVDAFIGRLFEWYAAHPERLPTEYRRIIEEEGSARAACDYIAGMTDNFALENYHELFVPKGWPIKHSDSI